MDKVTEKLCRKCNKIKLAYDFGKRKNSKDGLKSWCKECESKAAIERKIKNPKRAKEIKAKYRQKNRKKITEYNKKWRDNNEQHIKVYNKKYKQRLDVKEKNKLCMEKIRRKQGIPIRTKMPDEERKKKDIERAKKYYLNNKDRIRKYKRRWIKNKIDTDIGFKIKCRLSKRIWDALKGNCKSTSTKKLIGCDIDILINHLEQKFQIGMSWENYGDWHVDHIIPCASFDLTKKEQQEECFNYMNLQPLWAFDNLSKGTKIKL